MRTPAFILAASVPLLFNCGSDGAAAPPRDGGPSAPDASARPDAAGDARPPADSSVDAGTAIDARFGCSTSQCNRATEYCFVSDLPGGDGAADCRPFPPGCTEATACPCLADAGHLAFTSCTDDGGVTVWLSAP